MLVGGQLRPVVEKPPFKPTFLVTRHLSLTVWLGCNKSSDMTEAATDSWATQHAADSAWPCMATTARNTSSQAETESYKAMIKNTLKR